MEDMDSLAHERVWCDASHAGVGDQKIRGVRRYLTWMNPIPAWITADNNGCVVSCRPTISYIWRHGFWKIIVQTDLYWFSRAIYCWYCLFRVPHGSIAIRLPVWFTTMESASRIFGNSSSQLEPYVLRPSSQVLLPHGHDELTVKA